MRIIRQFLIPMRLPLDRCSCSIEVWKIQKKNFSGHLHRVPCILNTPKTIENRKFDFLKYWLKNSHIHNVFWDEESEYRIGFCPLCPHFFTWIFLNFRYYYLKVCVARKVECGHTGRKPMRYPDSSSQKSGTRQPRDFHEFSPNIGYKI